MTATQGREFDQALAALYGAAMGVRDWPEALEQLAGLTRTRCITLDTYDLDERAGNVLASNMAPHPAIEEYNKRYGQSNPLIETAYRTVRPGMTFRASQFMATSDFLRTDLYNTVYRAMGIRHVAGVPLEKNGAHIAQFSIIKPDDADDFSAADLRKLSHLSPHLLQAWQGHAHLHRLSASLEALTSLWNRFDHAVMVIDPRCKVLFANRAAEALLRSASSWVERAGRLRLKSPAAQSRLTQTLAELRNGGRQIVRLSPSSDSSVPGAVTTLFRVDAERIALVETDPARSHGDFRPGLRARFRLTDSEAQLVNALIAGDSIRDHAEKACVTYETARTHLKNAMRKNAWRNQGEMIVSVMAELLPGELFRQD